MPATEPQVHGRLPALYVEHRSWLLSWLRRRLGNAGDAADLTQDTFVRLLAAPESTPERQRGWALDEPRAYLTVIARRLVISLHRRRSLEQAYLDSLQALPVPLAPSPEHQYLILEALHEIDALLDGLPPAVREAFLLAQVEGLGQAEIAIRLQLSERTIKRHVARALAHCILAAPS